MIRIPRFTTGDQEFIYGVLTGFSLGFLGSCAMWAVGWALIA